DPVQINYTVKSVPGLPPAPIIENNCGSTQISLNGTPPEGVVWFWHDAPNSTTFGTTEPSRTFTTGSVKYIRAYNMDSQCWSTSFRTVTYTIREIPDTPTAPSVTNNCGNSVLTRTSPPTG